jgi:hypothetical protein
MEDKTTTSSSYPLITPSLAMLYQITNNKPNVFQYDTAGETMDYLWTNTRNIKLTYEEALEATRNINSPIWNDKIIRLIFNFFYDFKHFAPEFILFDHIELDFNFILNIFKQEAVERQKGKITFIHGRNAMFKIMNSFISLITNQDAFYLPKCKITNKSPKKAKEKYKEIYDSLPNEIKTSFPDMQVPFLKERLISTNISLLNNLFNSGSSSFAYFLSTRGNATPVDQILQSQIKDQKLTAKVVQLVNQLDNKRNEAKEGMYINVGQNILMFSFPEKIVDDYVFSTNKGARINIKYKDLNTYFQKFFGKKLWGNDFNIMNTTQFRIFDLCFYTFGKDDGIEIFEFDQSNMKSSDIEYTIQKKFTIKELVQLADIFTELPSAISDFTQWPPEYRKTEESQKDLTEQIILPVLTPRADGKKIFPVAPVANVPLTPPAQINTPVANRQLSPASVSPITQKQTPKPQVRVSLQAIPVLSPIRT